MDLPPPPVETPILAECPPADGIQGIWYGNQPIGAPYAYKYSGGLATYPQQHEPIAIYDAASQRTYFVYGASSTKLAPYTAEKAPTMEHLGNTIGCISYFDHKTRTFARPRQLYSRNVLDPHENPVLCIDAEGYLVVFCPSHGNGRLSFILRSRKPRDISQFDLLAQMPARDNFSYPQPWYVPGSGIAFLHTSYETQYGQRRLMVLQIPDSAKFPEWSKRKALSVIAQGNYQISWPDGQGRVGTAFDMHPPMGKGQVPLNYRTNIYFVRTPDGGTTWQTAGGETVTTPLRDVKNPALVYDAQAEGKLVYLKDIAYDEQQRPMILYVTATDWVPGPKNPPVQWGLAVFDGQTWKHHAITTSLHNYDHGSLYLSAPNDWRIIAPTAPGVAPYATGGHMILWQSVDRGVTWKIMKPITAAPGYNHTYARKPLNWQPDFAALWADYTGYLPGPSRLHFCDINGTLYTMPVDFGGKDFAAPVDGE